MEVFLQEIFDKYECQTSVKDVEELYAEAEKVSPRTIIEIGVAKGATLRIWSTLLNSKGLIIGIEAHDTLAWDVNDTVCDTVLIRGDSRHNSVKSTTADIIQDRQVDFLFIDGSHDYESVKSDYESYSKFVRPGGLIAFHDVNSSSEVKRFVLELKDTYKDLVEYSHLKTRERDIAYLIKE